MSATVNDFGVSRIRLAAVVALTLTLTIAVASAVGAQATVAVTDMLNAASQVADLIDHFADTGNFDPHQDMLVFAALRMTYPSLPPGVYAGSKSSEDIVYKFSRGVGACDLMLIDADDYARQRQARQAHTLTKAAMQCFVKQLGPTASYWPLHICNQFPRGVFVALAYQADGRWVSEGWHQAHTGGCATAYVPVELGGKMYFRGESDVYRDASGRDVQSIWEGGGLQFCSNHEVLHFFYVDANKPCADEGPLRSFRELGTIHFGGNAKVTLVFQWNSRTVVSIE